MAECGDSTLGHTCTMPSGHEGKHNDGRKEWGRLAKVKKSKETAAEYRARMQAKGPWTNRTKG